MKQPRMEMSLFDQRDRDSLDRQISTFYRILSKSLLLAIILTEVFDLVATVYGSAQLVSHNAAFKLAQFTIPFGTAICIGAALICWALKMVAFEAYLTGKTLNFRGAGFVQGILIGSVVWGFYTNIIALETIFTGKVPSFLLNLDADIQKHFFAVGFAIVVTFGFLLWRSMQFWLRQSSGVVERDPNNLTSSVGGGVNPVNPFLNIPTNTAAPPSNMKSPSNWTGWQ